MPTTRSVSLDQAAALLQVSRRTIYNYVRSGHLRTVMTMGGSRRVTRDSLAAVQSMLEGRGVRFYLLAARTRHEKPTHKRQALTRHVTVSLLRRRDMIKAANIIVMRRAVELFQAACHACDLAATIRDRSQQTRRAVRDIEVLWKCGSAAALSLFAGC